MGRKKKNPEEALGFQITVRLDVETARRASALVAKIGAVTNRVQVLRQALRLGLGVMEEQYRDLPGDSDPKPAKKR